MTANSALARLKSRVEFTAEEPGYMAVVILFLIFLALTPKAGCSFTEAPSAAPTPAATPH